MYSALYRVMLAVGYITFVASVSTPVVHSFEWRYEVMLLFLGPVLMFGGLILKYRKPLPQRNQTRSNQKIPVVTN